MREGSVNHQGQHVFVPDFTFHHEDGTEVLFEIVGYWTPEYLEQKRATLRRFRRHRILVAVLERSLHENAAVPEGYLVYKTALKPGAVLEALEGVRTASSCTSQLAYPIQVRRAPSPEAGGRAIRARSGSTLGTGAWASQRPEPKPGHPSTVQPRPSSALDTGATSRSA